MDVCDQSDWLPGGFVGTLGWLTSWSVFSFLSSSLYGTPQWTKLLPINDSQQRCANALQNNLAIDLVINLAIDSALESATLCKRSANRSGNQSGDQFFGNQSAQILFSFPLCLNIGSEWQFGLRAYLSSLAKKQQLFLVSIAHGTLQSLTWF